MHIIDLHFMGAPEAIAVYLMESDAGPILFETGPHSCLPRLEAELDRIGYSANDIKHVFLTHIHLDHAGAAWYFAEKGAKIYVHPKGEKHLLDPSRLVESATKIYGDQMELLWGKLNPIENKQLAIAKHQEDFVIGNKTIRSLHTPGHAVHHIAWHTDQGIVCGDVAGIKLKSGPAIPPCPPPDINFEDWRNSLDILLSESPEILHIAHFGSHGNAIEHLNNLKKEIDALDAFLPQLFTEFPKPKQAVYRLSEWMEDRIFKATDSVEIVEKYGIANPAWVNVFGMYRHYQKSQKA